MCDHTKELVRAFIQARAKSRSPLPSQEEIRRQLGWFLKHKS